MTKALKRLIFKRDGEDYFIDVKNDEIESVVAAVGVPKVIKFAPKSHQSLDDFVQEHQKQIRTLCPKGANAFVLGEYSEKIMLENSEYLPIQFYSTDV